MSGSLPVELANPKAKRRRKAIFSTASRMRQQKQQYDSLNNTMKALELTPNRTRSRSRIRRSQTDSGENIARKSTGVGTTREVEFQKSHDLTRIFETQV